MSSTRHAPPGSRTKQSAFCSSVEYDRGLLANIVANRAADLSPADVSLLFALQHFSWQPGGLDRVAADLIAGYPHELATPAMQKFGTRPGQIYNASQVKQVRDEIPGGEFHYLLQGEDDPKSFLSEMDEPTDAVDRYTSGWERDKKQAAKQRAEEAAKRPAGYPVSQFVEVCRKAAGQLADNLAELCLNPEIKVEGGPWWFPNLVATLRHYVAARCQQRPAIFVETEIVRLVTRALDYALETRELVMIYGDSGLGKSDAIKAWCTAHPGQARYVQVPPHLDNISFFRGIAEAYGVSSALSLKSVDLRERVGKVARAAGLALVFDEGHNLLCQDDRCRKRPTRISWIMTELVNYGVPVVICATPQFESEKANIEKRTGWNWDQFDRRIGFPEVLPKELSLAEMESVARAHFPEGDAASIKALVGYGIFSNSKLAGIAHILKKARFEVKCSGRTKVTLDDIQAAIRKRMPLDAPVNAQSPEPRAAAPRTKRAATIPAGPLLRKNTLPAAGTSPRGVRPVEAEPVASRFNHEVLA